TLFEELNQQQANRSFGNVSAEYLANNWLKFNYTLGADYSNDERLEACPAECSDVAVGGRVTEGKIVNYQLDHNLTATATYRLFEQLGGTFTIGQNLNARNVRTFSVVGRGLKSPKPFNILNVVSNDPPSDYQTQIHNESYFGQATIDLFDQLYLTAALRNDGSTTFSESNRRSWFPKASAAWTFTNVYKPPFITFGKLRLSYGEAGNEPQPYLTSVVYDATTPIAAIAQGTGLTPTQSGQSGLYHPATKPAADLRPERTRETEGGFDIGFWGEKADISATWYSSETRDVILVTPVSPSTGYSSEAKNAGVFTNKGAELSLNLRPLTRPNYAWEVGAGWGRNQSLAKSIAGAEFLLTDNVLLNTVAQAGQQLGVFRGNGWVRCGLTDPTAYPELNLAQVCAGQPKGATFIAGPSTNSNQCAQPGMPCVDDNIRIIGNPNAKWTGNVHSTFRYKKFELSGLVDVKKGGDVWNGTKGALYSYGTHKDTENRAICTGPNNSNCTGNVQTFGKNGFYPGVYVGPGAGTAIPIGQNWYFSSGVAACPFTGYDEPCMEDGGYVKLREISVAYSFDSPWVARTMGLSSIDLRVSGRNLKTW